MTATVLIADVEEQIPQTEDSEVVIFGRWRCCAAGMASLAIAKDSAIESAFFNELGLLDAGSSGDLRETGCHCDKSGDADKTQRTESWSVWTSYARTSFSIQRSGAALV